MSKSKIFNIGPIAILKPHYLLIREGGAFSVRTECQKPQ